MRDGTEIIQESVIMSSLGACFSYLISQNMERTSLQTSKAAVLCYFLFTQQLWDHTWSAGSRSGLYSTGETWMYWRDSSEWSWRWWKDWSTSPVRRGWGNWGCSHQRRKDSVGITTAYKYIQIEGAKRMESASFQWWPMPGQEFIGTNWNTGGSIWTSASTSVLCK